MPTPIDPKKLPRLRSQLKRFKDGDKLPPRELAKIYEVTNARFTTLVKERFPNFPPAERQGDKTHWYEVVPAIQSMIGYMEGKTRQSGRSAQIAASIMGKAPANDAAPEGTPKPTPEPAVEVPQLPTAAELDKIASAATKVFRLEIEKREFVRVSAVRAEISDLFTLMQRFLSGLSSDVDPHGELPPKLREDFELAIRKAQLKLHKQVAHHLGVEDAA